MAFDGRYLWVSGASGAVTQVDTTIGQVIRTIKVGGRPAGIAVTAEGVWVADSASTTVNRLALGGGQVNMTVRVGNGPVGFAQVDRDLWVFSQSDQRVRVLDPRASRVTRTVSLAGLGGGYPAVAGGAIWVPDRFGTSSAVWRIDPASGQVAARVETGAHPAEVAFGFGTGWVTHDEGVSRFDAVGGKELTRITGLGRQLSGVAVTPDAVWVTSVADNRLSRIDPATNEPVASLEVCTGPRHLTVVGDDLWVVCGEAGMLVRVHPN
jgi:YVTN family beta-propeller protein